MHSIRDLVSGVKDVNTGNRYKVEIFLPTAMQEWNSKLDKIQFYCKDCVLPASELTKIDSRVYGQKRSIGAFIEAGTTTTSFIFDYQGLNVRIFNAWQQYITKPDTKRLEYYENYVGRVRITLLNNLNLPIYICNLEEAYPARVGEIQLGYTQTEMLPLEIEWQYRTLSYMDPSSFIESAVNAGTTIGGVLSIPTKVQDINDAVTAGLEALNTVNNAIDRAITIGRIIDVYT